MGLIKSDQSVSPFWYKRICEITLLTSLIILSFEVIGHFWLQRQAIGTVFDVPIATLFLAATTAIFSLAACTALRQKGNYYVALVAYVLTTITVGSLVVLTGNEHSPFIALWLLVSMFAGLFGTASLLTMTAVTNAWFLYWFSFTNPSPIASDIVLFGLVLEAPLIASYIIWHRRDTAANKDTKAISALTQELSQVANKSEIVINSIADGVVAIDASGIIQLLNPAAQAILGWSAGDAIGLDYRSIIRLVDAKGQEITDELSPIRQVLLSNRSMTNNNLTLSTKSGKKIQLALTVSPVSESAKATGAIAVFRDVTEERQQERQKGEFISTASHEMRTPVAAIEGYLGLAMNAQTATIDDKARLYLQKAHESTQHLGRLFQDLLTVSKAEDSRLVVRPTAINAVAFAAEIVESLQPKAKEKGLSLFFAPGNPSGDKRVEPAYFMMADPDNLREVLSNLIDNAIKYTKQGTVTVNVTGDEHDVSLSVADSGIGIPPEDVPHLFQKFYRVDNSDTREVGGTGLGLYICRRLIEANNGHIGVNSIYGKGSTFSVQLPRLSHEQATNIINSQAAAPTPA